MAQEAVMVWNRREGVSPVVSTCERLKVETRRYRVVISLPPEDWVMA